MCKLTPVSAVLLAGYFSQRYLRPQKRMLVGMDFDKLCDLL